MPRSDNDDLALDATGLAECNGFQYLIKLEQILFFDRWPCIRPHHDVGGCGQLFAVGGR